MNGLPKQLKSKLNERENTNAMRELGKQNNLIDFSSNDYLGFSKSETIFNATHEFLTNHNITQNGATGSRLLSGNHSLFNILENMLATFHNSESALIFNSGYDANVGFFSSVPQRNDVIFYDEYIHASIRDGIKMSNTKAYKFKHNDLEALEEMLKRVQYDAAVYIVTESVFSMDGDSPNLIAISELSKKHSAFLVVDEAHGIGVFGKRGTGIIQHLEIEHNIFARIITFGKALGCHGAAILGGKDLKDYLINFSRSFIYTTALPPHSSATIHSAYNEMIDTKSRLILHQNIKHFKEKVINHNLEKFFIKSDSAIHCCVISGNENVKSIAKKLQEHGFDVKPILSPTVPKNQERLRFCLHSFNSKKDIENLLKTLAKLINL